MIRRAARVDANQSEIVAALRAIGVGVVDMSGVGRGFPDLFAMFRGTMYLLELKNGSKPPSARKLTVEQVRFHNDARLAGVKVHVVSTVDEALAVFGAMVA
jgi:Holliday junction resolvase